MKRALITGISGQDGSYLAELLLSKGYEVHGLVRQASNPNASRVARILRDPDLNGVRLFLHESDLADSERLTEYLYDIQPDEVYHLGAQSDVRKSFEIPEQTGDVTALSTIRILEAIRLSGCKARYFQAGTSEMFGDATESPQRESTPFRPRNPYGAAKAYAHWMTVSFRNKYGIHASNGILFNHESPRRGEAFVTRKITKAVAKIKTGSNEKLYLGNLDAKRDWGFAKEYVEAMWLMLQQQQPDDYVIATGQTHSVRQFLEEAFSCVGLEYQKHVEIDPESVRPDEVEILVGDPSKARQKIGWESRTSFSELVRLMVDADIALLRGAEQELAYDVK